MQMMNIVSPAVTDGGGGSPQHGLDEEAVAHGVTHSLPTWHITRPRHMTHLGGG